MRELHFVERNPEAGRVVLATSDGLEKFELSVDQGLREAVSDAPPAVQPAARSAGSSSTQPKIPPREIQMRIRAGETPQALAEAHGTALDWVLRFAGPVLAERERIADEARRAKARRSTTEGQTVVFGEAVDERFAAHGIDPGTVSWDAHRRDDGQWIITAGWVGGQTDRHAEWSFHLSARSVTPLDDTAADLLSDRPIRPIAAPDAGPDTAPSLTLAPPLAPGLVAFPAMPEASTGPLPRAEEVFDQAKFDDDNPGPAASAPSASATPAAPAPAAPATSTPAAAAEADAFDTPHLPMHLPDAPATTRIPKVTNLGIAARPDETEEEKAARATIPSWDDILLGVRRKRD